MDIQWEGLSFYRKGAARIAKTNELTVYWQAERNQNIRAVLQSLADAYSATLVVLQGEIIGEGIVVRSENHRVSFKIINPQFLLKYNA